MSFGLVQSGWGESECFNKNLAPGSSEVFKDIFRAYRNAPLDARKRRQYIEEARREGSQIKAKFKARMKTIEQQQRISLKEKAEALNRKRTKALKEKELLTSSIVYYGLWQQESTVDLRVEELHTQKEKRKDQVQKKRPSATL